MRKQALFALLLSFALLFAVSGVAEAAYTAPAEPEASSLASEDAAWYRDYRALLTDASVCSALIGESADYRTQYFSYDPKALDYQSWRLADINGDHIPELFMTTVSGLTDLFTWQDGPVYLGYDNYFGVIPGTGLAIVHGHWHGAGGSLKNEWYVSSPFLPYEERSVASFDYMWNWSVWEGDFTINDNSDEAKTAYESAVHRYVDSCIRLSDIPAYTPDEPEMLAAPTDLSAIPAFGELKSGFSADCSMFLLGYGWWAKADFCRNSAYPAALLDLDGDGLSELLIQNGYTSPEEAGTYVFSRKAESGRFALLGKVPTDLCVEVDSGDLYGSVEKDGKRIWSVYSLPMNGEGIQSYEVTWLTETPTEPAFTLPHWMDMRELCEALCNPDPENVCRVIVVSGSDLVDFCPATASVGSTVPVLTLYVTDGCINGSGAEGGEFSEGFYVFTMPDHDVELSFSFQSNDLA